MDDRTVIRLSNELKKILDHQGFYLCNNTQRRLDCDDLYIEPEVIDDLYGITLSFDFKEYNACVTIKFNGTEQDFINQLINYATNFKINDKPEIILNDNCMLCTHIDSLHIHERTTWIKARLKELARALAKIDRKISFNDENDFLSYVSENLNLSTVNYVFLKNTLDFVKENYKTKEEQNSMIYKLIRNAIPLTKDEIDGLPLLN